MGHIRLGTRGPLAFVLPSCSLWTVQQRGAVTWRQDLRRCQKDFAAHLDSPGSVLGGREATALAQPCQDLRRPECITPGIVPVPVGRKGRCLSWGQQRTQLDTGAGKRTLEDMGSGFITPMEGSLLITYGNYENQSYMTGAPMKEILVLLLPFCR